MTSRLILWTNFMPVKHPQFANGEIYHIIVRGIAGQKIFLEEKDYLRYLLSLYRFNDKKIIFSTFRNFYSYNLSRDDFPTKVIEREKKEPRDLLVEILGFCLMPNHIHLLVRQVTEKGVSLFLQKLGGYATYFNKKYQRFGSLFQRPFKAVHIKNDDQLLITATYIHLNPTDLVEFNWKTEGISNSQKVIEFLESYPWSSYSYYLGKGKFLWLINSSFLNQILKTPEEFQNFVKVRVFHSTELKNFLENAQKFSPKLE